MIFKNINFWNVSELEYNENTSSYKFYRLPKECEKNMLDQGKNMNHSSIGVELRFRMIDDEVKLILKASDKPVEAIIYFGSVQGEWHQSSFTITKKKCAIHLKKMNYDSKNTINSLKKSIYPVDLVRILFNDKEVEFIDVEGQVDPGLDLLPNYKYLSYGSSITANSITFVPMLSYPYLIAKKFNADLMNLGFPGSCRLEKEVADVLAYEKEFDFATIELGINIIDDMPIEEFYNRAYYLLDIVSKEHTNSKIFVIDIYNYFNEICGVNDNKLSKYRNVVKSICQLLNRSNIIYIPAKNILKSRMNLTADLVHPDLDGHLEIYHNLSKKIEKYL